jgi:hypothetical protein
VRDIDSSGKNLDRKSGREDRVGFGGSPYAVLYIAIFFNGVKSLFCWCRYRLARGASLLERRKAVRSSQRSLK